MNENKGWCKIIYTEKRDFLIERSREDVPGKRKRRKIRETVILSTHTNSCHLKITIGSDSGPGAKESMDAMYASVDATTMDKLLENVFENSGINLDELDKVSEEEE